MFHWTWDLFPPDSRHDLSPFYWHLVVITGDLCISGSTPPPKTRTVSNRTVRILLKCILVKSWISCSYTSLLHNVNELNCKETNNSTRIPRKISRSSSINIKENCRVFVIGATSENNAQYSRPSRSIDNGCKHKHFISLIANVRHAKTALTNNFWNIKILLQ